MVREITIALEGNPNTGKSTIFNNLTGGRQHVANWPGKTVEKKSGICKYKDMKINVVDLPGTYSLTAYSIEEIIARNYIVEEKPDVVVTIVDASNIERNLYLAVQTIELGANVVIALNMMDMAESRGFEIDVEQLSEYLGVPVIPTIANKGIGMDELLSTIVAVATGKIKMRRKNIGYGPDIEEKINELANLIEEKYPKLSKKYSARWLAISLLEEDAEVMKDIFGVKSSGL